ncbi:hypothetical protein PIB30_111798, partial [Stylosanthes scabra]|nr:hypothetical protein [Stylosanthes scabra]
MPGYWIWTEHGEVDEVGVNRNRTEPVANIDEQDERTKSLDRPVSMAEVFKQTHTLKANKEQFADKRSSDIW